MSEVTEASNEENMQKYNENVTEYTYSYILLENSNLCHSETDKSSGSVSVSMIGKEAGNLFCTMSEIHCKLM